MASSIRRLSTTMLDKSRHRNSYKWYIAIQSRWMDNDQYAHINNVQYHSYFDTAVNIHLVRVCPCPPAARAKALVKANSCTYFKPMTYPSVIHVGLVVEAIGNSSVSYRLATFENEETDASAVGRFTHVYVDSETGRPANVPEYIRTGLCGVVVDAPHIKASI
ncbi:hypothetical protein SeMB42_g04494 [Synchytrium endobioticum]|uniref:Thioesterase domain-containing protein n=1 Tax=Synchytrium endobioticum TaxID=286115 RepID=A0A507CXQ0_9FUNG|nr:hypothetical protein SeMB42_g04494 [Synchytrium endobioticum]TPX50350.1 hypothetical protein SeLEV6574_g00964 [Synchytrium endobioticum]